MVEPKVSIGGRLILASEAFARELGIDGQLGTLPEMKKAALNVSSAWVEAPLNDKWTVAFRLLIQNAMPIIGELRIFPAENLRHREPGKWSASLKGTHATAPAGGITMPLLRRIKLGIVRTKSAEALEYLRRLDPNLVQQINLVVDKQKKPRNEKRGRPREADITYARIADYYAKRCAHESLKPVAETAARFRIPRAKVRSKLHEARRRGLLTYGRQGIPWGELTEKARLLLKQKPRKGM